MAIVLSWAVPCLTASTEIVGQLQAILQANPQTNATVDLEAMQVVCGDLKVPVSMGEGSRQMLVTGTWDSCGQLVAQIEQVQATAHKIALCKLGKSSCIIIDL